MNADDLMSRAIEAGATDIHIEPEEQGYSALLRVRNILFPIHGGSLEEHAALVAELKVRAGIADRNNSSVLDGQFTINADNIDHEVRLAMLPVRLGEFICMRILRPRASLAA